MREIRLEDIRGARRGYAPAFAYIYARLYSDRGVALLLRRRIRLMKAVYITPGNPLAFVRDVNELIECQTGGHTPRVR